MKLAIDAPQPRDNYSSIPNDMCESLLAAVFGRGDGLLQPPDHLSGNLPTELDAHKSSCDA
jgi:hypothetical protein